MMKLGNQEPVVRPVYGHISNGGISFTVTNENGPTLVISSSHFGNNDHVQKIFCTKEFISQVGSMLLASVNQEFDVPYCVAVKADYEEDRCCGRDDGNCCKEGS